MYVLPQEDQKLLFFCIHFIPCNSINHPDIFKLHLGFNIKFRLLELCQENIHACVCVWCYWSFKEKLEPHFTCEFEMIRAIFLWAELITILIRATKIKLDPIVILNARKYKNILSTRPTTIAWLRLWQFHFVQIVRENPTQRTKLIRFSYPASYTFSATMASSKPLHSY